MRRSEIERANKREENRNKTEMKEREGEMEGMMTGCAACEREERSQWQVPVLFGARRQIRPGLSETFSKTVVWPFSAPLVSCQWQQWRKQPANKSQKRKRQKERGTKRKRDRGFILLVRWPHYVKAGLQESKRGRKRDKEGVIFRKRRREEERGCMQKKCMKWYVCYKGY